MEFRNNTEAKVIGQLMGTKAWYSKLASMYPFKIKLKRESSNSYAILHSDGRHTGTFISAFFVDTNECKELGWSIDKPIKDATDPDIEGVNIKLHNKRKKKDKTPKTK